MINPKVFSDLTELKAWELDRQLTQAELEIAYEAVGPIPNSLAMMVLQSAKGRILAEFARRRPNSHVRT